MVRQWENAADRFFDVLEIAPTNGEAWLELTWCLAEMGKWQESEMAARKSAEFMPNSGAPWSNLALALNRLGRTTEAESAIKRALELEPNDPRHQAILEQVTAEGRREQPRIGRIAVSGSRPASPASSVAATVLLPSWFGATSKSIRN